MPHKHSRCYNVCAMTQKIFSSALASDKKWQDALIKVTGKVKKDLGTKSCHIAIFFVSERYRTLDPRIVSKKIKEILGSDIVIGCNSSGVIGEESEVEMRPAISLLGMHLPGVNSLPFSMTHEQLTQLKSGTDLIKKLDLYPTDKPNFLLLADSTAYDPSKLTQFFNQAYKKCPLMGGLASGNVMGAQNWLVLDDEIYRKGALGIAMTGNIKFNTIVSQSSRPIGNAYTITRSKSNILYDIAGRPALQVLREILVKLSPEDQKLARQALLIGFARSDHHSDPKRSDFLIRNITGFDKRSGALMIGDKLKTGQTLQFHLKDSKISKKDLKAALSKLKKSSKPKSEGAFMVSCCARGKELCAEPSHDSRIFQSMCGPMPLAGFFSNGELAPIGDKNYVHGYTSTITILR